MLPFLLSCALITDDDYRLLVDADGDGAISTTYGGGDCDDHDATVFPGAVDACDGLDNDCDGETDEDADNLRTLYADADGDGHGDAAVTVQTCLDRDGWVDNSDDCDDSDAAVYPGAPEDCDDTADVNCDGVLPTADDDGDGWPACNDCDPNNSNVHPLAPEYCNAIDDDCDGDIDEDAVDASTWYVDADGDGWGSDSGTVLACEQPEGTATAGGDCNDADPAYHPSAQEDCTTGAADYNCDGWVGTDDHDGDGYAACDDCDDGNPLVNPGGTESCNDIDDDCDGTADEDAVDAAGWYADTDGDGFGDSASVTMSCDAVAGSVSNAEDCDDTNATVFPGAVEYCNGLDDDCNGDIDVGAVDAPTWYADADGDGYGDSSATMAECEGPEGFVADSGDCDDTNPAINPGATEVCDEYDTDEDCNGLADDDDPGVTGTSTWYLDYDGDGHGDATNSVDTCVQPSGYVKNADDCDDNNAGRYPGHDETCDGEDNNCSGDESDASDAITYYADADGDGYGDASSTTNDCSVPAGYSEDDTDCDDTEATTYPGATEILGDGVDSDCDGYDNPARSCPFDCESTACAYVDAELVAEQTTGWDSDMSAIDTLVIGRADFDDVRMYVDGASVVDEDFSSSTGCFSGGVATGGVYDASMGDNDCALTAFDATTSTWGFTMHIDLGWSNSPCTFGQLEQGTGGTGVGTNWCLDTGGAYLNDGAGASTYFSQTMDTRTSYEVSLCSYEPGTDADGDGWVSDADRGLDCDDSDPTIHPAADEITEDGIDQNCDGFDQFAWESFEDFAVGDPIIGTRNWVCVGSSCVTTASNDRAHLGARSAYTANGSGEIGWGDSKFTKDFGASLWFYDAGNTPAAGNFAVITYKGAGGSKTADLFAGWTQDCGSDYCVGNGSTIYDTLGARSTGWHYLEMGAVYSSTTAGDIKVCIDDDCATGSFSGVRTYIGFNDDGFYGYVDDFRAWSL